MLRHPRRPPAAIATATGPISTSTATITLLLLRLRRGAGALLARRRLVTHWRQLDAHRGRQVLVGKRLQVGAGVGVGELGVDRAGVGLDRGVVGVSDRRRQRGAELERLLAQVV